MTALEVLVWCVLAIIGCAAAAVSMVCSGYLFAFGVQLAGGWS